HSSRPPREQKHPQVLGRGLELVTLDGACRVNVLGAYPGAFTDEGAAPDAFLLNEHVEAFSLSAVASVQVVPLGEGDSSRADEVRLEAVDRTGRIAQHAVDAVAELLVLLKLLRGLQVFAVDHRYVVVSDDPRLDPRQLLHE